MSRDNFRDALKQYEWDNKMNGLEALSGLYDLCEYEGGDSLELYKIIEKELKALNIIIKKQVDINLFLACVDYKEYNLHYEANGFHLTQDEFDILKEVLENEEVR